MARTDRIMPGMVGDMLVGTTEMRRVDSRRSRHMDPVGMVVTKDMADTADTADQETTQEGDTQSRCYPLKLDDPTSDSIAEKYEEGCTV